MRNKFKKQATNFSLVLGVFTFAVILGLFLFYNSYLRLYRYCGKTTIDNQEVRSCDIFLEKMVSVDGKSIIKLLLPDRKLFKRKLEIKMTEERVEWENPYEIDNRYIPINLTLYYNPSSILKLKPKAVRMVALEDGQAINLLDSTGNKNNSNIPIVTKRLQDVANRGYYSTVEPCNDNPDRTCNSIQVINVRINDYIVDESKIVFSVSLILNEGEYEALLEAEAFTYLESSKEDSETAKWELLDAHSELDHYINKDNSYSVELLSNRGSISQEMFEDYIENKLELTLILKSLIYHE